MQIMKKKRELIWIVVQKMGYNNSISVSLQKQIMEYRLIVS